jgi:hypothetical protein
MVGGGAHPKRLGGGACPKRERNGKNRVVLGATTVLPYLGMHIIRRIRNGDATF